MKAYLDSTDTYYSIKHGVKTNPKQNKDYASIGAIIFTFTVLSIVIGLSVYTAWQIAYGQESPDLLSSKCIFFHGAQIAIISIPSLLDTGPCSQQEGLNVLEYFAVQGYQIKAVDHTGSSIAIYLQR